MSPELEIALDALKGAFGQVDELNRELKKTAQQLSPVERAQFIYAYRMDLAIRLCAMSINDADTVATVAISLLDQLDELAKEMKLQTLN